MTPRTETVVLSSILSDPPPTITGPVAESVIRSLRLRDPDYEATVAAGYVEPLEKFEARITPAPAPVPAGSVFTSPLEGRGIHGFLR